MTSTDSIRALVVGNEGIAATLSENHDIEATGQPSAREALDWLGEGHVDCIVSDYEMPGMDGHEFLATVRERHDEIPFVLLLRSDDEEVVRRALEYGVTDCFLHLDGEENHGYERLAHCIERTVRQHRTRQVHERLVEHSSDAIAHVAANGAVLTANPAMAELLGTTGEDVVGTSLTDVLPEDIGSKRLEAGREAIKTGEAVHTEDTHDGRYLKHTFLPVRTDGTHDSFHLVSRNLTPRKERERKLERRDDHLDEFASVVSHDLRNPLNVAQSSVELMAEEMDSEHLDRIDRSLDRMNRIIDDVLVFARQGDTVDSPSPVDLARMVREAWSDVDTGEMELVVEEVGRIEANADGLQESLGHLIRNALEHGEATTVTVGTLSEPDAEGEGDFYLADDGSGLPESGRDDVFETGFSTGRGGTGLGLSIVREIANAHGWTVSATESESGGARFEFRGATER